MQPLNVGVFVFVSVCVVFQHCLEGSVSLISFQGLSCRSLTVCFTQAKHTQQLCCIIQQLPDKCSGHHIMIQREYLGLIQMSAVQYDPLMVSPSHSVFLQSEDGAGANKSGEGTGIYIQYIYIMQCYSSVRSHLQSFL